MTMRFDVATLRFHLCTSSAVHSQQLIELRLLLRPPRKREEKHTSALRLGPIARAARTAAQASPGPYLPSSFASVTLSVCLVSCRLCRYPISLARAMDLQVGMSPSYPPIDRSSSSPAAGRVTRCLFGSSRAAGSLQSLVCPSTIGSSRLYKVRGSEQI
jgi:hypothetical protein